MKRPAITKLELILLVCIVLLAAWLRFSRLNWVEFLWDQAEISKWALRVGQEHRMTWIGPISSTKLDTFPGAIWLLAIPYAISTNPVFATGFVAAINLSAVIACYLLTRHWLGREAALVATLLFAVSPWAVIYSRKIWHTELLPPFTPLYVVTGWFAFVKGRRWAMLAHSLALAAMIQLHFAALPFVLLTALWALLFCRRIDWRWVPLSALVGALTFVPYFVVDAQKDWRNLRLLLEIMRQPTTINPEVARYTWAISTGLDLHWLTGPDRYPDFVAAAPNARWLFAVEGSLTLIGGLTALVRGGQQACAGLDDETATGLMLVTWLITPALFLASNKTGVAPHYFTTTLPAQFILIGWLVAFVQRKSDRMRKPLIGVLLILIAAIAVAQIYETTSALRFVMTHDTRWGYGTPIIYEQRAVQTTIRLGKDEENAEVILLSEGDDPRMYEMPAVADVLMYDSPLPHRSIDVRTTLAFPANPAIYWSTYDMTPGEELLNRLTSEIATARIWLREEKRSFRFYRWPGGEPSIPNAHPLPGGPRTWANGARLIGYQLRGCLCPGETVHWTLIWKATSTPTENTYYHWFNHLVDDQGQIHGQRDGPSLLPAYWRAGDTILNWFDVQVSPDTPPGSYTMRVGMYAYPTMENISLVGSSDVSPDQWAEIGPLRVRVEEIEDQ